ncbi:MAG: ATP-binding cassette domain-containing protein [Solirubrobacterales bacterium]|nr:ATP-binding cassette domain-containing protein [Solirubrobacterales bacterium]
MLLVSHQLDEVLAHTDRVTVLRDGRVVAGGVPTSELSERELIRLMLGRELARPRRRTAEPARTAAGVGASRGASPASAVAASIHDLRGPTLAGASFSVGKGEVLGVTGLLGSGFEELPYLIAAARPASAGMLALDGLELDLARASPRAALDAGVALVPERRASDGLALGRSVIDNVTLPRVRTRGALAPIGRWQQAEAEWVLEHLGVRPADPHLPVAHLSGGNQQKVLLGKWLLGAPRLLVLHEPTQGVDVGARLDIERALVQATERGCGVILAGMDMPELASICDRVLVMRDGLPVAELAHQLSPERIIDAVYADGAGE